MLCLIKKISLAFLLSFFLHTSVFGQPKASNRINLLFLIDASGSMQKNDPADLRKMAGKVLSLLISDRTQICIIEFANDARVLLDWTSVTNQKQILTSIDRISNNGSYTDFLAGIKAAKEKFNEINNEGRNVLLLFTDGIFEPNPYSDRYPPYYLAYRKETLGEGRNIKRQIYKNKYLSNLKTVAFRQLMNDIIPQLKRKNVEIFNLGLSPNVDQNFLSNLDQLINNNSTIVHNFFAIRPAELLFVFTDFLKYLDDKTIVYRAEGQINLNNNYQFNVDSYLREIFFILFTDNNNVEVDLSSSSPKTINYFPNIHPNIRLAELPAGQAAWAYHFNGGNGTYSAFVVAKSALNIVVSGIERAYSFPANVRGTIRILPSNTPLDNNSCLIYRIHFPNGSSNVDSLHQVTSNKFNFSFQPPASGNYQVELVLHASINGEELLPRPGKSFRFYVRPALYVEPRILNFGTISTGKNKSLSIRVYLSAEGRQEININGNILHASRCSISESQSFEFEPQKMILNNGYLGSQLTLNVPDQHCWGDFEGELNFATNDNKFTDSVKFYVHIPSIWEYLTYTIIILLLILFLTLIVLIYLWGTVGKPRGVLEVLSSPLGIILQDSYKLNSVKRKKFLARFFNWKRNKIIIGGGRKGDIHLPSVGAAIRAELMFTRFSRGVFVSNYSDEESNVVIKITKPELPDNPFLLSTTQQIYIEHNTIIEIEGYKFKYLDF